MRNIASTRKYTLIEVVHRPGDICGHLCAEDRNGRHWHAADCTPVPFATPNPDPVTEYGRLPR